jgi:putative PIN family toxin of toxin-antitoxin system
MRVVLDTNVLVSAALKRNSTPGAAVGAAQRIGVLLKSAATEAQLFDVLARPYFVPLIDPETRDWLRRLMALAEPIRIVERIVACRDPTDDKFLELAVCGNADLIVSGDADLVALHPFRGIPIVTPAVFACRARS